MPSTNGTNTLAQFKRETGRFLKKLKKSGAPLVLTVRGRAEVVVFDAAAYQRLLDEREQQETIAAVKESMAEYERGESMPALEALEKLRHELKLPRVK